MGPALLKSLSTVAFLFALLLAKAAWELREQNSENAAENSSRASPRVHSGIHSEAKIPCSPADSAPTWSMDFAPIERQFATYLQGATELTLNENLFRQLQIAVQALPSAMSESCLERIEFLLSKSFPGATGKRLAALFTPSYHFQAALKMESERIARGYPAGSIAATSALLESTEALQRKFFSPREIEQLFGRSNELNRYLLARRRVREDARLSAEQKRVALQQLQQSFRGNP